jgi:CRP-like cAMP-binding protein
MRAAKQELARMAPTPRTGNRLLDCLVQREPSLAPDIRLVASEGGREIYHPDGPMPAVYFPTRGVVSLIVRLASGGSAEVATVGPEGMVGLSAMFRARRSPMLAVQQIPGELAQLPTTRLLRAMQNNDRLAASLNCYAAYAMRAAYQTAACNALHRLEARAARWLLMTADRAKGHEFDLTQQMLADMLGVGRQSVNEVASRLQRNGLIEYRRGHIALLQRERLEKLACECYATLRDYYEDLMG